MDEYGDIGDDYYSDSELCGETIPDVMTINSSRIKLTYKSERVRDGSGFHLEWLTVGCGGILTHPEDTFSTPDFPNRYPINTQCNWTIQVLPGNNIEVTFLEVDIEKGGDCNYDFVRVFDGLEEDAPVITNLCGRTDKPIVLTSSQNIVRVQFESDSSFVGRGMQAKYKAVPAGRFLYRYAKLQQLFKIEFQNLIEHKILLMCNSCYLGF